MITIHPRSFYIGTTAERTALSLPVDAVGAFFFDTTLQALFIWTGSTWQTAGGIPVSVARLRNGVITEYSDPDDAFSAADTAGDIILVPPGDWSLSSAHTMAASTGVMGFAGHRAECVLKATADVGTALITLGNYCTMENVRVEYTAPSANARKAIYCNLDTGEEAELTSCQFYCHNGGGDAYAADLTHAIVIDCDFEAETGTLANAYGCKADSYKISHSWAKGTNLASGVRYGVGFWLTGSVSSLWRMQWCYGYGYAGSLGHGCGLLVETGHNYIDHSTFEGNDYDIRVEGASTSLYLYSCQCDVLNDSGTGSTITQQAGDRAGKARDETISGVWTHSGNLLGSGAPTLGSFTESEKWGHTCLALTKDIYPDGEYAPEAGLMARFINRIAGVGEYTSHARSDPGLPFATTPTGLYAAKHPSYTGVMRGTYFAMMSNDATLPLFQIAYAADPIAASARVWGRFLVTSGCEIGLWADNYDSDHTYVNGERIYAFSIYLQGNGALTDLKTRVSYTTMTGGVWPAWTHVAINSYAGICPVSEGIVLALMVNYAATVSACYGYIMGEQGGQSGIGSAFLYIDAGVTPYGARRMGMFERVQGFGWSCWDLYYLTGL